MKNGNNILNHTQQIESLNDLRMQKLRLEMGMDFLEERLGDNVHLVKEKLSPKNLAGAAIDKVIGKVDGESGGESKSNIFMGVFLEVFLSFLKKMI